MQRVCVYCGSSAGWRAEYGQAAGMLSEGLASHRLGLVFGGGKIGLMGVLARAILARGGEVIGVIPRALQEQGLAQPELTKLRVVETMHERKALMAGLSDGFVALPGGLGTLEEFFEILTWAQLGLHSKPCGLLNVGGYFDHLIAFLDHAVQEGFIDPAHRALFVTEPEPQALLDKLAAYEPPLVDKVQWALGGNAGLE
ncbi:MAG: TIGR00730 family Rossman fold protein [Sedimentisphaerales bacterium]|nr:TIGR00730 family Rossman fold protein [Sedimentisphaerales bacterium]